MTDLFADDPIETSADDRLDHNTFADQIVRVIGAMREQTPSGVCVVAGPWGSGKSSVLRMLEAKLRISDDWSVVSFNPWLLSDEASLVRQFFSSLASVLPREKGWKRSCKALAGYLTAVSPVVGALQVPGVDLGKASDVASKALAGDVGLDARKRELEDVLSDLPKPVLVLLDDLDRLHPDELMIVFKLVRLIGRLPNVYYVLAFDEGTIVDLLESSDIGAGSKARALTFLEKVYQVRLELPPLHSSRRSRLLDEALEEFLRRHDESFSDDDQYRFATAYHKFMSAHLRTPRQIKRYVAQLDVYYPLVIGEVDLVDFMLITFLRASLPQLYALLGRRKNELTLTMESSLRRDDRSLDERRKDWEQQVSTVGLTEGDVGMALDFLGQLFLPVKSVVQRTQYGNELYTDLARHKRVGSADYFDRYFYFGVQPDDVPDQLIDKALAELADQAGPCVRELRQVSKRRGSVVFEKLLLRRDRLSSLQRSGVLHLLADIWDNLPNEMFTATRTRAVLLGAELLPDAGGDALDLDRLTEDSSHLLFTAGVLANVVRAPNNEDEAPTVPQRVTGLIDRFVERALAFLERASNEPLEGQEEWVIALLFRLRELTTAETVTQWLMDRLDESAWTVEDLAAALVPVATTYGGGRPTKVLAHADVLESLVALLPLDWIIDRLEGLEEAGEPLDRLTMTEDDLTFENRIRHAKAAIRIRMEQGDLPGAESTDVDDDSKTVIERTEEE